MIQVIQAVYESGILRPLEKLNLKEREQVEIAVRTIATPEECNDKEYPSDPLEGIRVATGIPDLAEHFDDYRFGRREP